MLRLRGRRSVFVRLMSMQLLSMVITLLVVGVLFGYLVQRYYFGVAEWEVIEKGERMVSIFEEDMLDEDVERIRERIYTVAESSNVDLWVINDQGNIVAGSRLAQEDPYLTLQAGEIQHVLAGNNITKKVRGPVYQNLLIVLPLMDRRPVENGEGGGDEARARPESPVEPVAIGALAMRAPLGNIGTTVNNIMRLILMAAAVAGLLVFFVSLSMAKGFARPLEQIKRAALDIAEGRYSQLAAPAHSNEVDHLVAAFNHASREIERTANEQRRLEHLRKEFLSDLSHELRVPLTSLRGFLELMEERVAEPTQERYRRIMLADTKYLGRLVEDVLELSKIESGYFALARQTVDVQEIIESGVDSVELQLDEKGIQVEVLVEPNVPQVKWDPHRIQQVLLNLLLNAVEASEPGSRVVVRAAADGNDVVLAVEDFGAGIPDDKKPYIWERFYKLDQSRARNGRKYQGSGLGLAIVREIVQAHGGTISVDSQEGEGTCFTLRLPKQ